MRPRKRADWPIVVYRYHVRPTYEIWERLPDGATQEIESIRELWNQLTAAFEQRQSRYREITVQSAQVAEDTARVRTALAQLQQDFLAETRRLTTVCSATWANKEFILTQFLATVSRFFKKQGKAPKPKYGVPSEVHFHHRFAGGGVPIDHIFGRSQRLRVEPVAPDAFHPALSQRQRKRLARTAGVFQVGDTALTFQLLLHRPLPEGGILKTAALIGRRIIQAGFRNDLHGGRHLAAQWVWSLHLTMEIPPRSLPVQERKSSTVVLDISRQVGGEGRLRVGVVVDATGREEPMFLPEEILRAWQYKRQLQQHADQLLDETKSLLKEIENRKELPTKVYALLEHIETQRSAGLWRLWQGLEKANADGEILEILQRWADRATKITREARGLGRRYLAHRDWFYRNVAAQFCRRYQQIVVKLPHRLEVQEAHEDGRTPQEATTYRHLAAPSMLLSFLRHAASKTGCEIKEAHAQSDSESHLLVVSPAA